MPNFGVFPQQTTLLALATVTTTGSSGALVLPPASSYRVMVEVQTVSGTSPTLVVGLATSFNSGTTYDQVMTTTTLTTSSQGAQLLIRPYLGTGDAATSQAMTKMAIPFTGAVASLAAATIANGPINPQNVQITWVAGGTSPSFAFQVGLLAVPQDTSD
jgi:hypothetical protein